MIVCLRTVAVPPRARPLPRVDRGRPCGPRGPRHPGRVGLEPTAGDGDTVVVTVWPDHDTFDAWIATPERDALTASDGAPGGRLPADHPLRRRRRLPQPARPPPGRLDPKEDTHEMGHPRPPQDRPHRLPVADPPLHRPRRRDPLRPDRRGPRRRPNAGRRTASTRPAPSSTTATASAPSRCSSTTSTSAATRPWSVWPRIVHAADIDERARHRPARPGPARHRRSAVSTSRPTTSGCWSAPRSSTTPSTPGAPNRSQRRGMTEHLDYDDHPGRHRPPGRQAHGRRRHHRPQVRRPAVPARASTNFIETVIVDDADTRHAARRMDARPRQGTPRGDLVPRRRRRRSHRRRAVRRARRLVPTQLRLRRLRLRHLRRVPPRHQTAARRLRRTRVRRTRPATCATSTSASPSAPPPRPPRIHSIDCRCQTRIAVAARKLGVIHADVAVALSLSLTHKAVGFDRAHRRGRLRHPRPTRHRHPARRRRRRRTPRRRPQPPATPPADPIARRQPEHMISSGSRALTTLVVGHSARHLKGCN